MPFGRTNILAVLGSTKTHLPDLPARTLNCDFYKTHTISFPRTSITMSIKSVCQKACLKYYAARIKRTLLKVFMGDNSPTPDFFLQSYCSDCLEIAYYGPDMTKEWLRAHLPLYEQLYSGTRGMDVQATKAFVAT
jgi:hypothetical protein